MDSLLLEKNFMQKMWIYHGQSWVTQAIAHWYTHSQVHALRCVPLEPHKGSWEPWIQTLHGGKPS